MPVRIGDTLSTWHYDSGAGISQFTPRALPQLEPYITKVDWDDVKFVTAKDISRTSMTLYKVDKCSLMQMSQRLDRRQNPPISCVILICRLSIASSESTR